MDQNISLVTALLNGLACNDQAYDARVVPEADFVPFDLSHLRDFSPKQGEQASNPCGGHGQNASDALPA
jgi:hypothetical protein